MLNQIGYKKYIVLEQTSDYLKLKARTGPSQITKIPLQINEGLAFLTGIILGDGHLTKSKKRIALEMTNLKTIIATKNIIQNIFEIKIGVHKRLDKRENRQLRYYFYIYNSMIYHLLNQLGIPIGKKSDIVYVPYLIKNSKDSIKKAFLLGVFCAEGGKRRWKYYGLSSSSQKFRDGVYDLLKDLKIEVRKDQWVYKKYKKEYFGLYFEKSFLKNMRECRSGQTGRILNELQNSLEVQA